MKMLGHKRFLVFQFLSELYCEYICLQSDQSWRNVEWSESNNLGIVILMLEFMKAKINTEIFILDFKNLLIVLFY